MHVQPKLDNDLQRTSAEKGNRGGDQHISRQPMTTEILPTPQSRAESAHNLGQHRGVADPARYAASSSILMRSDFRNLRSWSLIFNSGLLDRVVTIDVLSLD